MEHIKTHTHNLVSLDCADVDSGGRGATDSIGSLFTCFFYVTMGRGVDIDGPNGAGGSGGSGTAAAAAAAASLVPVD